MEEFRIDLTNPSKEEMEVATRDMQNLFRLNHTMPGTDEYNFIDLNI